MKLLWQWNRLNEPTFRVNNRTKASKKKICWSFSLLCTRYSTCFSRLNIDIVCARLYSLLFYSKINTDSSSSFMQIIWNTLQYRISLYSLSCPFLFPNSSFSGVKIGSTQHLLPISRKLHQIKWATYINVYCIQAPKTQHKKLAFVCLFDIEFKQNWNTMHLQEFESSTIYSTNCDATKVYSFVFHCIEFF